MASARSDQKNRPHGGAQGAAQSLLICATTSLSRGPSLAAPPRFARLCVDFRHHSRAETAPNRQRQVVETQRKGQLYVAITTFVSLDKVFQVERHVAHLKIAAVCAAAVVTSITRGTHTR